MEKFKQLQIIKELYAKGDNIIQYLKSIENRKNNTIEDILISYDFQSGSYVKNFFKNRAFNDAYCEAISSLIDKLGDFKTMMEVGVGEATTLNTVIRKLKNRPSTVFGFDISWSRMKFAKELLADFDINDVTLFVANLFEIPLPDNSIDVVYTSHSIEPNGGKEKEALEELYRITNQYLILLEPSYEFANEEAKKRMEMHGYVTKLYSTAAELGYKIIEHRPFDLSQNPLNPTGLIIIEKDEKLTNSPQLQCPISKKELIKHGDSFLYSPQSYLAYPILEQIPCLLKENSILATHLLTNYDDFKRDNDLLS